MREGSEFASDSDHPYKMELNKLSLVTYILLRMWFVAKVVSEDVIQFLGGFRNKINAITECIGQIEDKKKWIGLIEYEGECPNGVVDIVFKFGPLLRVEIQGVYNSGNLPNDLNYNEYEIYEEVVIQ